MSSSELVHEEARNALEALALDALDASERTAVLAHVDGCSICRAELTALENAATQLAYVVRPVAMADVARDRVKRHLMTRVARRGDTPRGNDVVIGRSTQRSPVIQPEAKAETPGAKPLPILFPHPANEPVHHEVGGLSTQWAWWLAAAASLVAAVSLASLYQVTQQRDAATTALHVASGDMSGGNESMESLRAGLTDRERMIANLTGPEVAVMTLAATGPNAPSARMFWNRSVNAWTLVAHNLPMPAAGRVYQLWLVTAKEKISAGTFMPRANGDAMMRATYAMPKEALAAVSVTDEPEAGSTQPTTTPVLVSAASAR